MDGRTFKRRATATAALALALSTAACSAGSVAQKDVEQGVADQLEKQVGDRPEVSCASDLKAEVGKTVRCELTADDGSTIGATVTVDKVDGDDVDYTVQVDNS